MIEQRNLDKYNVFIEAYDNGEIIYQDGALYRVKRNLNQNKAIHLDTPELMRMSNPQRYYRVHTKGVTGYEHIVIYAIFHGIDSLKDFETIDHLDGDKRNNKIENLEGVSIDENNKRAKDNGLLKTLKGMDNGNAKLTDDVVEKIKQIYGIGKYTQRQIAKMFGTSQTHVSDIVNNKKRKR